MNTNKRSDSMGQFNVSLEVMIDEYQLSQITGRSVASLRRDRLLGVGFPYVKLGALVRYRPTDIRTHIERNMRNAGSVRHAT